MVVTMDQLPHLDQVEREQSHTLGQAVADLLLQLQDLQQEHTP